MSLKLIFPSAGLIGSVATAIFSAIPASSKQEVTINTSKEETRKAQDINSFEITLKCSQNANGWASERDYYTFKITSEVLGSKAKELMEKQMVDVGVDLEIKAGKEWGAIEKFTRDDSEQVYMTVQYWNQKGLNVKLSNTGWNVRDVGSVDFWCKGDTDQVDWSASTSGDTLLFFTEVDGLGRTTLMKKGVDGAEVRVSLVDCQPEGRDSKVTACSLKLGDVAKNQWSIKVPEKTKFRYSK